MRGGVKDRWIDPAVNGAEYDSKNNLIESIAPNSVSNGASVTCSTNVSTSINAVYATDYTYDITGVQLLDITRKFTDPDLGQQTAVTKVRIRRFC